METKAFSLKKLKEIFTDEDVEGYRAKQKPTYQRTKDYIISHVSYLEPEDFIVDGVIVSDKAFSKKIRHFPKPIREWFNTDHDVFKKPVVKFDNEPLCEDEFNLLAKSKHSYKEFTTFPKAIRNKAMRFINNYLKPVLCNNRDDIHEYLIKWLAKMIQGHKNTTMIVLKGPEGCGKSSLTQMICKHILGRSRTYKSSSTPLTSKFNIELMAKQFVYFEELRAGNKTEQEMASSNLKDLITDENANYEAKNKAVLENIRNISSFLSCSNQYYAIKDNQGRRYFILDIDISYLGNSEFWDDMYNNLMCDEVGECLYSYFHEVDIKDYKEMKMPITDSKISSHIKSYTPTINFIRDNYLFEDKEMNIKTNDLYNEFCSCTDPKYQCKKTYFYDNLKHYGLNYRKTNGYNKYVYSKIDLQLTSEKHKWHYREQAESHDISDDDSRDTQTSESDLKIEKLKKVNKTILNYMKNACPEHFDNILDILNEDEDITNKTLTISSQPIQPKAIKTKKLNEKVKIKLSTTDKAQKEKEEKDKKVYEKRSKELKDKGKKNMKSSMKWFE